jgi:hypothetical protein
MSGVATSSNDKPSLGDESKTDEKKGASSDSAAPPATEETPLNEFELLRKRFDALKKR